MATLLIVILVLVALGAYFTLMTETCPSCGTELGVSVGGVRTTSNSCRCGWRRDSQT